MSYGLFIKNVNGSEIFQEGEIPLQYWGKKTYYVSGNGTYSLFNLPDSASVSIYTLTVSGADSTLVLAEKKEGKWVAQHYAYYGSGEIEIYVFVNSTTLPKADWGMELYDSTGTLVFTGTRPMLQTHSIHNASVPLTSVNPNEHSGLVTSSDRLAVNPSAMWVRSYLVTVGQAFLYHYVVGAKVSGSGSKHGVREVQVGIIPSYQNYGAVASQNYPAIDTGYYNKFHNLPSY